MAPVYQEQLVVDKQSIKWMELPIMKFNEVAVPHHVNKLKTLKINILKCQRAGDWTGAHREQVNASVVVKQLRTLVKEMDILRGRIIDSDVNRFDKMINNSRQAALNILQEFMDLSHQMTSVVEDNNSSNSNNNKNEENVEFMNNEQLQLCLDTSRLAVECQQQEKCAIAWENLQKEIEEVHQLYEDLAQIVHMQGESVTRVESNTEVAHEHVVEGNKHLAQASRLKVASYPLTGALIGTCVGGPVGFVAGLKVGGLAALTCSILGFTGGKMLKSKAMTEETAHVS
ncbi:syntaxin 17 [Lycorma delicatula]|uniref:syntaxin 17 n=1 Tax=Lycorma delicatula TaxID=130591 RepID=UPI003F514198